MDRQRTPASLRLSVSLALLVAACGGGGGGAPVARGPVPPPEPQEEDRSEEEAPAEGDTVAEEKALAGDDSVPQVRRDPLAGLFLGGQAYQPSQAITREPLRTQVHENHPTDKPVFYLPSLTAVLLPFGVADNNLFRLVLDGTAMVFRASPDYEAPSDTGNGGLVAEDGEYHIQLLGLDSNSRPVVLSLIVRVIDQPQEMSARQIPHPVLAISLLHRDRLSEVSSYHPEDSLSFQQLSARYPEAHAAKVIQAYHWTKSDNGPLLLTWLLRLTGAAPGVVLPEAELLYVKSQVRMALSKFERAANIIFVEHDGSEGQSVHMYLDFTKDLNRPAEARGRSPSESDVSRVEIRYQNAPLQHVILHEIGHALGLKHSFDDLGGGWPVGSSAVRNQPWSIMNYGHSLQDLTVFDVAALQYLYGAPSSADSTQSPANQRPTDFRISKTAMTLPFASYEDVVLATIHVVDDGLGMALPILIGNEGVFRLERYHDHWRLLFRDNIIRFDPQRGGIQTIDGDHDLETTIRLLANGAGSDVTPDLTFTLTVEDIDTDQPFRIAAQRIRPVSENADTSSSINMARVVVLNKEGKHLVDEYNFQEGLEITIGGEDAALFEMSVKSRYPNYLHLRAGVTLDHETNPSLDVVIVVSGNGTNLTRSISIPVTDVPEPGDDDVGDDDDAPLLTGVHKTGAQLGVSVAHNRQIVIENVEWTRQGADDVLSAIEIFRADAPGTYQVKVTYWLRSYFSDAKQPSRTWTKTFMIAPLEDTATADGRVAQGPAFDLEEPHNPEQNDEAVTSSLPDIA